MTDRVRTAMSRVDRAGFLPEGVRRHAGIDTPLSIGHGQTNSQPLTVAIMLRLLDVGSGSGWSTALLADLLEGEGSLEAVELVPELVAFGQENLTAAGVDVQVHQATEGVFGLPELAPFDRILVSAEATEMPTDLLDQLALGGIMVIPVAGEMLRVERLNEEEFGLTRHGAFRFVPLLRERE